MQCERSKKRAEVAGGYSTLEFAQTTRSAVRVRSSTSEWFEVSSLFVMRNYYALHIFCGSSRLVL